MRASGCPPGLSGSVARLREGTSLHVLNSRQATLGKSGVVSGCCLITLASARQRALVDALLQQPHQQRPLGDGSVFRLCFFFVSKWMKGQQHWGTGRCGGRVASPAP